MDNNDKLTEKKIEKYPMAESQNLIEFFGIAGYEELYIQGNIIKEIELKAKFEEDENDETDLEQKNKKENPEKHLFKKYIPRNLPTILFSIGSW